LYMNSGKIKALVKLLDGFFEEGRRVLIFSQFTQVLDILRAVLDLKQIKYLLLTGQTAVDTRLGLVDEFNQDETIPVFLLSTKAGGMGINLTAASVVILYDQDFNPHNDKQAADRAYRIGQKRDVDVIKLISKGTIEVCVVAESVFWLVSLTNLTGRDSATWRNQACPRRGCGRRDSRRADNRRWRRRRGCAG